MRILCAHNFYREEGGENAVFRFVVAILRDQGHKVTEYIRDSHEIDGYSVADRARMLSNGIVSAQTKRDLLVLIQRERPDVALVQNVFPMISPVIYSVLKEAGIPIVQLVYNYRLICPDAHLYTQGAICERCVHGSMFNAALYRCYRDSLVYSTWYATIIGWHRLRGTFAQIDHFCVPDDFMRRKLGEGGFPMTRMTVVGNPFDISDYTPSNLEENYFLFIGRLIPQKGILTLIRAFAQAQTSTHLLIIGEGENRREAEQIAYGLAPERIRFISSVWGEEVRRYIARSLSVCIPSEWYDNAPLVLYQSYAMGKPVIASRINGLPEVVAHDGDGLLAEPGNVNDWAEKITQLAGDVLLRRRLGAAARQKAEREFTQSAYYHRLRGALDAITSQPF